MAPGTVQNTSPRPSALEGEHPHQGKALGEGYTPISTNISVVDGEQNAILVDNIDSSISDKQIIGDDTKTTSDKDSSAIVNDKLTLNNCSLQKAVSSNRHSSVINNFQLAFSSFIQQAVSENNKKSITNNSQLAVSNNSQQAVSTNSHEVTYNKETSKILELNPAQNQADGQLQCPLCDSFLLNEAAYSIHVHQYHANPNLLSKDQVSQFSISNHLITHKLDEIIEPLYRCHECFAIMGTASTLRGHLKTHKQQDSQHNHLKQADDLSSQRLAGHKTGSGGGRPEKKLSKMLVQRRKNGIKKIRKTLKKFDEAGACEILKPRSSNRPQRQVAIQHRNNKELEAAANNDLSEDEFNSNSENESDLSNRKASKTSTSTPRLQKTPSSPQKTTSSPQKTPSSSQKTPSSPQKTSSTRPQRECKSRTKTLVAISLAEQDYDKFDLDFGKFKTDVANRTTEPSETPSINGAALFDNIDDHDHHLDDESEATRDDIHFTDLKTAKSLKNDVTENGEHSSSFTELKVKETKKSKEQKSSKKKSSSLKNHSKPYQPENNSSKAKFPTFNVKDRKKVGRLVTDIVEGGHQDYVCLSCSHGFNSYLQLITHKNKCSESPSNLLMVGGDGLILKKRSEDKGLAVQKEPLELTEELSKYITESVFRVPETTFNNMHGKINHLTTHDANTFVNKSPNALGLVRMNYSGDWTVKDVWETAGWEPKDDQLSWQSYEVLASVNSDLEQSESLHSRLMASPVNGTSNTSLNSSAIPHSEPKDTSEDLVNNLGLTRTRNSPAKLLNGATSSPVALPSASTLTRKLTSQITDRQRPVISNNQVQRNFLYKLSSIPWAEQRMVKESFDSTLTPKKNKRLDKSIESQQQFKHPTMPSRLDLRQVGKSVKYSRNRNRHNWEEKIKTEKLVKSKRIGDDETNMLTGEWEIEHTYMCSVCGIEYDDVVEIMHHKWEAHPHCLVTHVCLKHNLQRPPALLYPQVGPSKVTNSDEKEEPVEFNCSKCQEKFAIASDFHAHILLCGGLALVSPTKRGRRRKGHGGGLKSTVRMLKKSSSLSDENSPRKKLRPPRDFNNVPLVPTHSRSTRFKENKEKEAKALEAKEKRGKSRRGRKAGRGNIQKKKTGVDHDVKKVVRNLLDQVEGKNSRKSADSAAGKRTSSRVSERSSSRRASTSQVVSQDSSGQATPTHRSNRRRSVRSKADDSAPETPKEIIDTVNHIIEEAVRLILAKSKKKVVRVIAFNDYDVTAIINHESLNIPRTPLKRSRSNSTEPLDRELTVDTDYKPVRTIGNISPVKFDPPASRVQKRLQSDLTDKMMPRHNLAKRRRAVSRPTSPVHRSRRSVFPLDFKISVLNRIESGEALSTVAGDLDLPVNVVAKWWQVRTDLWSRSHQSESSSDDNSKNLLGTGANDLVMSKLEYVKRETMTAENGIVSPNGKTNIAGIVHNGRGHKRRKTKELTLSDLFHEDGTLIKSSPLSATNPLNSSEPSPCRQLLVDDPIQLVKQEDDISKADSSTANDEAATFVATTVDNHGSQQKSEARGIAVATTSRPRRQSTVNNYNQQAESMSRQIMPIEVKKEAINRINDGESQVTVARDLDVSVSTISSWWRKKDSFLNVDSNSRVGGGAAAGDDIEDQTIEELVQMEVDNNKENKHSTVVESEDTASIESLPNSVEFIDEIPSLNTSVILELAEEQSVSGVKSTFKPATLNKEVKDNHAVDGGKNDSTTNKISNGCESINDEEFSKVLASEEGALAKSNDSVKNKDQSTDINDISEVTAKAHSYFDNTDDKNDDIVESVITDANKTENTPDKIMLIKSMKLAFNSLIMKADAHNIKDLGQDPIAKEEETMDKSDISAVKSTELLSQSNSVIKYAPKTTTSETVNNHVITASTNEASEISTTDPNQVDIPEASSNLIVAVQSNCLVPKKRKSLELLANSLMKKAALVAHTTAIPSQTSEPQAGNSGLNKNNCVSRSEES